MSNIIAGDSLATLVERYLPLYRASAVADRVLLSAEAAANAAERAQVEHGNERAILERSPKSLDDAIALIRLAIAYLWDHDSAPDDQSPQVRVLQAALCFFGHQASEA